MKAVEVAFFKGHGGLNTAYMSGERGHMTSSVSVSSQLNDESACIKTMQGLKKE